MQALAVESSRKAEKDKIVNCVSSEMPIGCDLMAMSIGPQVSGSLTHSSSKFNLVNDDVIAFRGSLNAYRRESVKNILADVFTFEVARAVDQQLSKKLVDNYTSNRESQRLAAVMFSLSDAGFLYVDDDGRSILFCFGPRAKQLDDFGYVSQEKLEELAEHRIRFAMKKSEVLRSKELSRRYLRDLDLHVVQESWKDVGSIIDYVLDGNLRLIGPASKGGLIVEHVTRSTPDEKCYVWFALGDDTQKSVMVDLAEPVMVQGRRRFPAKSDGQLFVTLGFSL